MELHKQRKMISLGFVTVRYHESLGYIGGYLIVNSLARPLEFHCTLPVQPTRAQQILYGSTLQEFVCGEQIARALVQKAKCSPEVLFADTTSVLSLRWLQSIPIAAFELDPESNAELLKPQAAREDYHAFQAFGHRFLVLPEHADDAKAVRSVFDSQEPPLDLLEPFGRIEEALMEAHPGTKAA